MTARREEACLFCPTPRPAGKYAVVYEDLCDDHQWFVVGMAVEEHRLHPEGRCTETCGCKTFDTVDELRAYLEAPDDEP